MTDVTPYTLLITDDDAAVRETLRDLFEPAGYQTYLAASGEEALDIVRERDVHLALMDFQLPRMTGLETVEMVRQLKGGLVLPTILITALQDETVLRRALSAQVFCVLNKPVSPNIVIYTVDRAIRKYYVQV